MRHALPNAVTVKAVCPHDCPDTCGMVVTVDPATGRAVDLRGDKEHPFTRGFLCQKVNNYLDRVYHPDRLLYPLQARRPEGRGEVRAHLVGRGRPHHRRDSSRGSRLRPTGRRRSCRTATPGRWAS